MRNGFVIWAGVLAFAGAIGVTQPASAGRHRAKDEIHTQARDRARAHHGSHHRTRAAHAEYGGAANDSSYLKAHVRTPKRKASGESRSRRQGERSRRLPAVVHASGRIASST
jgi:hypothetical protein